MPSIVKSKITLFSLVLIVGLSLYNYQKHFQSLLNNTTYHFSNASAILPSILYQAPIGIYEAIKKYTLLLSIKENNKKLIIENQKLVIRLQNKLELQKENQRLKALLNLKIIKESKLIVAKVISVDIFDHFLSITVSKGSADGVEKLQGALSPEGVVGMVRNVYKHTSQIILLLSNQISIDSINQRSRVRTLITGYKNGFYTFIDPQENLLSSKEIQEGDLFISSGLQKNFPEGLPIGRIFKITKAPLNKQLQVLIKPAVSFNTLEEVFIVKKP
ncbi:MAG: rod shape-determining protein MreC [Bdellovibrionaceae bacterium]|nr:rod shape-determining protein MreC [Pseudobdellovibrionaceae bacterium]